MHYDIGRSAATGAAIGVSLFVGPEAFIASRVAGTAAYLMRGAEITKPLVSGAAAAFQRFSAVTSNLRGLAAGEGRIIASGAVAAGEKGAFRGAEAAATKYGGGAADYTKVSVSRLTEGGDRVSVHAVRNEVTGRIYEPEVIYGR